VVTLQQAWDLLKRIELFTNTETIPISLSSGRVAFKDVVAEFDAPPFTQSRFDGFALGKSTKTSIFKIVTSKAITAGDDGKYLLSDGEAIPIMTGAPIPEGTRKIVPREMCQVKDKFLYVEKFPRPERMILKKGADFSKGHIYLKRGEQINPIHVAYMALDGRDSVEVFALPHISVISSGDELIPSGPKQLKRAKIRNSHPALIQALLSHYAIVSYQTHVSDDIEKIKKSLIYALNSDSYVVITTGGMGKGIKDLTRKALRDLGTIPLFEGINSIPIGTFSCYQYKNKVIFSLPGGMVGVLLLTKLFISPFIRKIQGWKPHHRVGPFVMARPRSETIPLEKKASREMIRFIKARAWEESGERWVVPLDSTSLIEMNAFIVLKYNDKHKQKIPVFLLWDR